MGGNFSAERGVKRPHGDTEVENETSTGDLSDSSSDLHTPKRKRFQSTAQYIVKKLFEEGTDSDVTIRALGKSWHLHKIYLSQCKYFDSMFSGQWLESEQPDIIIEITDENIDAEALRIAFKSLYTDSILVKPIQAVGVLAAATFLQLDPLIEHCRVVMKGCITCKTVCSFLAASECYGLLDITDLCMNWLLRCLMVPKNAFMLSDIREELLMSLLDSRELWIMQVEVDVYCLLKKWMFTQLNPLWSGNSEELYKDASDFYKHQAEDNGCCFLDTAQGRRFIHMFEKVRWIYIINDSSCIQSLQDDQIVPYDWLNPVFQFCWNHHLKVEQGLDVGPREVSEDDFSKWSMRCGRVLMHEQEYHWRWLGYTYGLDLLFTLRNRALTISRNCGSSQRFPGSLSQQELRYVMLCVKVSQIKKKEICAVVSTGIMTLTLQTDDNESFLLALTPAAKFPLQVTMQLLYINPDPSQAYPSLAVPPAPVDIVPSTPPPVPLTPSASSSKKSTTGGENNSEVCGGSDSQRQADLIQSSGGAIVAENQSEVNDETGSQSQADWTQSSAGNRNTSAASNSTASVEENESRICENGSQRQAECNQNEETVCVSENNSCTSGSVLQNDCSATVAFVQADDSSASRVSLTASQTLKDTTTCSLNSGKCSLVPGTSQTIVLSLLNDDERKPVVMTSRSSFTNVSAAKPSLPSATVSSSVVCSATPSVSTTVLPSTTTSTCSLSSRDRNMVDCSQTANKKSSSGSNMVSSSTSNRNVADRSNTSGRKSSSHMAGHFSASDRKVADCSYSSGKRSSVPLPSCVDLPSCSSWSENRRVRRSTRVSSRLRKH